MYFSDTNSSKRFAFKISPTSHSQDSQVLAPIQEHPSDFKPRVNSFPSASLAAGQTALLT